jgi:hypothetical protein
MDIDLLAEVDNMTGSVAQIRIMIGKQMSNILEIFSGITSMLNNRIGYIQHMQIGVSSIINDLHDIMQCDMSIQQKYMSLDIDDTNDIDIEDDGE